MNIQFDFYRISDERIRFTEFPCQAVAEIIEEPYEERLTELKNKLIFLVPNFYLKDEFILLHTISEDEVVVSDLPSDILISLFTNTPSNEEFFYGGYKFRLLSKNRSESVLSKRYRFRKLVRPLCFLF